MKKINKIIINNFKGMIEMTEEGETLIKKTAKFIKTQLGQYDLKVLDQIRDVILHKKGNETLIMSDHIVTGKQIGRASCRERV